MSCCGRLDGDSREYLMSYYRILEEMIQGMCSAQLSDSISSNFIVKMIPHHRAAIQMSRNVLRYTDNLSLRSIATNIITEQTKSIENMQRIERECRECRNSCATVRCYQDRTQNIMQAMFSEMKCACYTNRINCNFMWEMIPHHEGAVKMSNNTLHYDICPQLIPILDAIIISQKRGIAQMTQLLNCLSC